MQCAGFGCFYKILEEHRAIPGDKDSVERSDLGVFTTLISISISLVIPLE